MPCFCSSSSNNTALFCITQALYSQMSRGQPHPLLQHRAGGHAPRTEALSYATAALPRAREDKTRLYFTALSIYLQMQHKLQLNCSLKAQGRCIPLKGKWRVKESTGVGILSS